MTEEQLPSQRRGSEKRDQQLLTLMKEDFDAGFGKVVEDYWCELSRWAYRLLQGSGYAHLSDDAVQEGLFSAYNDLRRNRQKLDTLNLQHWLYTIVRHEAIACFKQRNKMTYLAGLLGWENEGEDIATGRSADEHDEPAYCLERHETVNEAHRTVTELLTSLPETQRAIVVLKYFSPDGKPPEEIPLQQIAQKLNKPAGTVRSDISRAIKHMRKRLMEQRKEDKMLQKSER
jgi:RNA polymerase sigma factor (sigma-70 family)